MGIYQYLKRICDVMAALLLLLIAFPIGVLIAGLLIPETKGEVFYTQLRFGRRGKIFQIWKFRTLLEKKNNPSPKQEGVIGKLLRRSKLDELPQVINILMGDMSFVGPRPLLPEYLVLLNENHRKRVKVLPGLTGLTQVSGGNGLSWSEKFDLDVHYVQNQSILGDLKILLKTIFVVLQFRRSIPAKEFKGYN